MRSPVIQSIFAILVFSLLSACSGKLTGSVFLDNDGDTEHDDEEAYLGNLPFTVTKDGADYAEGVTDSNGDFSVDIKGAGEYCVEVSQVDLLEENVTLVSALTLPRLLQQADPVPVLAQLGSEAICDDNLDNDSDGNTDCDDSDCSADSACNTETDCDDNSDNDSDGDTDCDDSDCVSATACDDDGNDDDSSSDEVRESGRSCKDSASASVKLTVPVSRDFSVDGLQEEDPVQATVGETVQARIRFPASCEFNLYILPEGVEPADTFPASAYESTRRRVNFNEAIAEDDDNVTTEQATNIAEDDLSTYEFSLVIDDDFLDSDDLSIEPSMECPDGSTVTLQPFTIEVDTDDIFEVTNEVTAGTVGEGQTVTITTTVTNTSNVDYGANEVTLVFTASSTANFELPDDAGCTTSTSTATCEFALGGEDSVTFDTEVELPTVGTDPVTVSLETGLTIESGGNSLQETDSWERTFNP